MEKNILNVSIIITPITYAWTKNILNVSFSQTPINGKHLKYFDGQPPLTDQKGVTHLLKIGLQTPLLFRREGRQQGHNISLLPIIGQDSVSTYQQGGRLNELLRVRG